MVTDNLSPEELAFLVNFIAIDLCKGRNTKEIERVATLYSSIASQMFLIISQRNYIEDKNTEILDPTSVSAEGANINPPSRR